MARQKVRRQKVRAQPIGISAAPNSAGQARGEGERWPVRPNKAPWRCLFLADRENRRPRGGERGCKIASRPGERGEPAELRRRPSVRPPVSFSSGVVWHARNWIDHLRSIVAFGEVPMARLLSVRIVGVLTLCSLAILLVSLPFLNAAPVTGVSEPTPGFSVNRYRKGDRLPLRPSGAIQQDFRAPPGLQSRQKAPFGCDRSFSPVTSPVAPAIYGRCMA